MGIISKFSWNLSAHGDNLPIPTAPASWKEIFYYEEDCSGKTAVAQRLTDEDFIPEKSNSEPHLISQVELNDLFDDLYLSKQAELLGSCLKQWNLLHKDTKVTFFRNRNKELIKYFIMRSAVFLL